jgi:hypothetical protein
LFSVCIVYANIVPMRHKEMRFANHHCLCLLSSPAQWEQLDLAVITSWRYSSFPWMKLLSRGSVTLVVMIGFESTCSLHTSQVPCLKHYPESLAQALRRNSSAWYQQFPLRRTQGFCVYENITDHNCAFVYLRRKYFWLWAEYAESTPHIFTLITFRLSHLAVSPGALKFS